MPSGFLPSPIRACFVSAVSAARAIKDPRRVEAVCYLCVSALLICSGWIRPPLTADITPFNLSLGLAEAGAIVQSDGGAKPAPADNAGLLLSMVLAIGAPIVIYRPQSLGTLAGVLLASGIVVSAVAVVQHPLLLENLMDESTQRMNVVRALDTFYEHNLSDNKNARVMAGAIDFGSLTPLRMIPFLLYGNLFMLLSMVCLHLSVRGRLIHRLSIVAKWIAVGVILAIVLCRPRLQAEYYLYRANRAILTADIVQARKFLDQMTLTDPKSDQLRRTWLLRGYLDYEQGILSSESDLWRAEQYRNLELSSNSRYSLYKLHTVDAEPKMTRASMAQVSMELGLANLGREYLTGAEAAFDEASHLKPLWMDSSACRVISLSKTNVNDPSIAKSELDTPLNQCADRMIVADLLNALGDAYFDANQMSDARICYRNSWKKFNTLKSINLRAQKGLGGL